MTGVSDSFQRPINYLRVSVTDRCNLRCIYCMPEQGVQLTAHENILSFEEIFSVIECAAAMGINKVRLTGGEPLVRKDITRLVRMIAGIKTIDDISLTTNGVLLSPLAEELKEAGLGRVNISLDTLQPKRFTEITRRGNLADVLAGVKAAQAAGLNPVKINTVVMAGINDDEITAFTEKTVHDGWHVRFIELMPSEANGGNTSRLVTTPDIIKRISAIGELTPANITAGNGPARYFQLSEATGTIGFITPISEHFCIKCNRLRLTADGKLRPCLMNEMEVDLRQPLRNGAGQKELSELVKQAIDQKPKGHLLVDGKIPGDRSFSQVGG
ncbi:GTP 3',8-cyclase MoaA [Chloroflexota bacterium]